MGASSSRPPMPSFAYTCPSELSTVRIATTSRAAGKSSCGHPGDLQFSWGQADRLVETSQGWSAGALAACHQRGSANRGGCGAAGTTGVAVRGGSRRSRLRGEQVDPQVREGCSDLIQGRTARSQQCLHMSPEQRRQVALNDTGELDHPRRHSGRRAEPGHIMERDQLEPRLLVASGLHGPVQRQLDRGPDLAASGGHPGMDRPRPGIE